MTTRTATTGGGALDDTWAEKARSILRKHFGHDDFRPSQRTLVEAVLAGRDVLGVMPTGAGKSVVYQVPALVLEKLCIVVSPLISLMKDQVNSLVESGVPAAFINSSQSARQRQDALDFARSGICRLLYVAPERLLAPGFVDALRGVPIGLVAVDEAHCVSHWGQDFRPSYLDIAPFLDRLEHRPPVAALTATATAEVRNDVIEAIGLIDPLVLVSGFDRPNLYFGVERPEPRNKIACLLRLVRERSDQSGIVYCSTRTAVEEVCEELVQAGFAATRYHAGLSAQERTANQEDFIYDRATVMVATNAFGMGIDKSNVGYVIHYNMPGDIESYYQEAGRAGRDGSPADCILIYNKKDVQTQQFLIDRARDDSYSQNRDPEIVETTYKRDCERLRRMTFYCTTTDCLRSTVLRYFGERDAPFRCEHCSNCTSDYDEVDVTVDAQKVASCVIRVARTGRHVGKQAIVDVLRGSKEQRILGWHLDELSTYGIMADASTQHVRYVLDTLVDTGYLGVTDGKFPTVFVTPAGMEWLVRTKEPLVVKVPRRLKREDKEAAPSKPARGREVAAMPLPLSDAQTDLYNELRALRSEIASREGMPAYIVFSNATLADMARKSPRNSSEFLGVSGVGETKAQKYGTEFLACIDAFLERGAE